MPATVLQLKDINHALPLALPMLRERGNRITAASVANERPTIEWPGVFITEYLCPDRCVLFDPVRDCNPFFHYLEALWIIAGRNDVKTLGHILPKMAEYSDNGETFHAAYGDRLRYWPSGEAQTDFHSGWFDQIERAVTILRHKPTSRQVVLSIWDPARDLGTKSKDLPCNDLIMLKVRDGKLNMTVNNRSNDVVWGCYGANSVQFSMLLMYLAARIGVRIGTYTQVSDSFHVYEDNPYWQKFIADELNVQHGAALVEGGYYFGQVEHNLFLDGIEHFGNELADFWASAEESIDMKLPAMPYTPRKSTAVLDALLVWNALTAHRAGDKDGALHWAGGIAAQDWSNACVQWLQRRYGK